MAKSLLDTDIFSELLKGVGAVGVAGMAGAGWAHLDHPAPLRSRRWRRRRAAWRLALLWWTNRELIHHGAELGLLRGLLAAQRKPAQGDLAMCRSIKQLRRPERDVSEAEIEAAARQFVRKVSGYRVPGRANAPAFEAAAAEIAATTQRLMAAVNALPPEPSDLVQPDSAAAIS